MRRPGEPDPVRDAFTRWLARNPELEMARLSDPLTATLMTRLRHMLVSMDDAMQNEGIDLSVRLRVVSAALYGTAGLADEAERREQADQQMRQLMENYSAPRISEEISARLGHGPDVEP